MKKLNAIFIKLQLPLNTHCEFATETYLVATLCEVWSDFSQELPEPRLAVLVKLIVSLS